MRYLIKSSSIVITTVLASSGYFAINSISGDNKYPIFNEASHKVDGSYVFINDEYESYIGQYESLDEHLSLPEKIETKDAEKNDNLSSVLSELNSSSNSDTKAELTQVVETQSSENLSFSEVVIEEGDSFISAMKSLGISPSDLTEVVYNTTSNRNIFLLNVGDSIQVTYKGRNKEIRSLSISTSKEYYHVFTKSKSGFKLEKKNHPVTEKNLGYSFSLNASFFKAAIKNGLSHQEAAKVQSIFKHKVDFNTLQKGTRFVLDITRSYVNSQPNGSFTVNAARVLEGSKVTNAFLWKNNDEEGYYDSKGDSLLPSFLRDPVKNPRITSRFNPKRLHPILKIVRPHRGTDYAGNRKPIMSIGDGVIVSAGKKGGFGNAVVIKHSNGIQTLSAHMSKINKGIVAGAEVKRGQVIGLIGSTGLATGPHLHFEMKVNGKHVDSLKHPLPMHDSVVDKVEFIKKAEQLSKLLDARMVEAKVY